jgi:hypothetical protein
VFKEQSMSFLSGLKVFGMDVEKAFAWFGSPKGQAVVAAGEAVVETIDPAAAPVVSLFNAWAGKAYNIEAIAVAAGKGTGTGAEKAAAVITAVGPDVQQYEQQAGVSARTAAQIQAANVAAVAFINAMTAPATASASLPMSAVAKPTPLTS